MNLNHQNGQIFRHGKDTVFFGNENFKIENFEMKNSLLWQVHGKEIIEACSILKKADGHYTSRLNHVLVIKTADCMPVFISSPERIVALHIGWRGLMHRIFSSAVKLISNKTKSKVFIGPHIKYKSFELDKASAESLLKPHNLTLNQALSFQLAKVSLRQTDHFFLDLEAILKREINSSGLTNITTAGLDTYTSFLHYSHRRSRLRIGQNYSFIVRRS